MSNIEKSFVRGFIKFLNKQIQEKNAESAESIEGKVIIVTIPQIFYQIYAKVHDKNTKT